MRDHRDLAHALLRVTVATVFLTWGGGTVHGASAGDLVTLAVPTAQIGVGALLLIGLFTPFALVCAAALIAAMTFMATLAAHPNAVGQNVAIALAIFALDYTVERNGWSVDAIVRRVRSRGAARPQTTMLRVHTSGGDDLVFGVMPTPDATHPSLFIQRADEMEGRDRERGAPRHPDA